MIEKPIELGQKIAIYWTISSGSEVPGNDTLQTYL